MATLGPLQGRIHPAGWPFIFGFLIASLFLWFLSPFWGLCAFFLTGFCTLFFREPTRVPPHFPHAIVAPADGIVVSVGPAVPPSELGTYGEGSWTRVSIFLSVFDVHVTRIPATSRVVLRMYNPGQFVNASFDKASDLNERNSLVLETAAGERLIVVQIAGLIARRILCDALLGDDVSIGQTYGIIRFGSRVDLYIPATLAINVQKGQRMVGGETVIAQLSPVLL
jgi:phosphatidylserine decarboxylase